MSDEPQNLEALLGLSVEVAQTMKEAAVEAAKERHPSGKALPLGAHKPAPADVVPEVAETLTAADRCDAGCGAGALYRLRQRKSNRELDLCHHHGHRYAERMGDEGWTVVDQNPGLMRELYGNRNRHQGSDH